MLWLWRAVAASPCQLRFEHFVLEYLLKVPGPKFAWARV